MIPTTDFQERDYPDTLTNDDCRPEIDIWIDRAQRMVDYREEAADFLRRASSILPAIELDVELVCRLWTAADEYDIYICEALQRFDQALFDVQGQLEITRGAEPASGPNTDERLVYLCTWALVRPEDQSTSVVLSADQVSGRLDFEVRDSAGGRRSLGFPIAKMSDLYESLTLSFFAIHGHSAILR